MGTKESSTTPGAAGSNQRVEETIEFPLASVTDDTIIIDVDKRRISMAGKQRAGKWIPRMCLRQRLYREAARREGLLPKRFSGVLPIKKFTRMLSASKTRQQQTLSGTERWQLMLPEGRCQPMNRSAQVNFPLGKRLTVLARIVFLVLVFFFEVEFLLFIFPSQSQSPRKRG